MSAESFNFLKNPVLKRALGCAAFITILRPLWKKWLGPIVGSAVGGRLQKYLQAYRIKHAPDKIILYYTEESESEAAELSVPDSEVHLTARDVEKARDAGRAALSPLVQKQAHLRFYCSPYWRAKEALSALLEGVEWGLLTKKHGLCVASVNAAVCACEDSKLRRFWKQLHLHANDDAEPQGVPDAACRAEGHFLFTQKPSTKRPTVQQHDKICLVSDPAFHLQCFNHWKVVYDIEEDVRLRDQELGFGRVRTERVRDFLINNFQANMHHRFSGAESGACVYDRLLSFKSQLFEDFNSKPKVDCCVLVAHKTIVRLLLCLLSPKSAVSVPSSKHSHQTKNLVVLVKDPCCGTYSLEEERAGPGTGTGYVAEPAQTSLPSSSVSQDSCATPRKSIVSCFEKGRTASRVTDPLPAAAVETLSQRQQSSLEKSSKNATEGCRKQETSLIVSSRSLVNEKATISVFSSVEEGALASLVRSAEEGIRATAASVDSFVPLATRKSLKEQLNRQRNSYHTSTPPRQLNFEQQHRPSSGKPRRIPDCTPPQEPGEPGDSALDRTSRFPNSASAATDRLLSTAEVLADKTNHGDWVPVRTLFGSAVGSPKFAPANVAPTREPCFGDINSVQFASADAVSHGLQAGICATVVAAPRERSPRAAAACQNLTPVPVLRAAAEQDTNTNQVTSHTATPRDAGGECQEEPLGWTGAKHASGSIISYCTSNVLLPRGRSPGPGTPAQPQLQQDCVYYSAVDALTSQTKSSMPPKQPLTAATQRAKLYDSGSDQRSRSLSISTVPRARRSLSGPQTLQSLSTAALQKLEESTCPFTPRRCLHSAREGSPSLDLTTQPSPRVPLPKMIESAKK